MARQVVQFVVLLAVLCESGGQRTTSVDARSRCVYTFNVPASECGQTPDSNTDIEVVKSVAIGLQAQIKQLVNEVRQLRDDNVKMKEDNVKMKQQLAVVNPGGASEKGRKAPSGGVVYVRWGRKTCPGNATLMYSGIAGGSYHSHKGGGANYECLPRDPQWGEHTDGLKSGTYIYGAEYKMPPANSPFLKANYAGNLVNNNVPCAVCHVTERHVKVMIPARKQCPAGWTREYGGYLTTSHYSTEYRTMFECLDEAPEVIEGAGGQQGGAWLYTVEGDCGYTLPCPNYVEGWALTCVVCTK